MKTIGLIGGMSWESTVTYYQIINKVVQHKLGGLHSAKCMLYSIDLQEIAQYQEAGEWDKCAAILTAAAQSLECGGAEFIVICSNTAHKTVPQIQRQIHIPVFPIAEATADAVLENKVRKVGLLGTQYTMVQNFYKDKLVEKGLEVVIPAAQDVALINGIIFQELCLGTVSKESKRECLRVIDSLAERGAQGIILGCTEIGMLVNQGDTKIPLFDTTLIHAAKAAAFALK